MAKLIFGTIQKRVTLLVRQKRVTLLVRLTHTGEDWTTLLQKAHKFEDDLRDALQKDVGGRIYVIQDAPVYMFFIDLLQRYERRARGIIKRTAKRHGFRL